MGQDASVEDHAEKKKKPQHLLRKPFPRILPGNLPVKTADRHVSISLALETIIAAITAASTATVVLSLLELLLHNHEGFA